VALAAAGYGPLSLAWASFGGVVISFVALLVLRPKAVLRKPSLKHWRRILSFGGQASLASFIGHLGSQAPDLIIGRLLGFHAVGLYSRAQGLVLAFEQQFTRSVTTVAFPAYARAHREGHSLKLNYLRGLCYVTVFAWPFFAVLFLVAEPLILLLFGDQWRASAPVARALCVAGAVTAAWSLSPHLMLGAGRVGMFVRLLAATESCRITLIFMAAVSGQSLEVIAWVQAPISLLSFAITTHILGTISEIGFLEILRGMRASALVSLAVLLSSGAAKIGVDGSSELVVVAAVGSAGAITWLIVTFAFRHPITSEIGRVTGSIRSQLFARIFQPVRKG
jgi:O-antigen/teichoic acid export membrane protein